MKTKIRIFQGHQIGGCITEISTSNTKIIIDFGESLPGSEEVSNIEYDFEKEKVDAVFFTHYHGDHTGRIAEIPIDIPLYMGEITYKVLLNFFDALKNRSEDSKKLYESLTRRTNIHLIEPNVHEYVGDIVVTPYSVDHSAFDSYMYLVSANGENILHTGDYRDHGHRGYKILSDGSERNIVLEVIESYILKHGNRKINALITEGTNMNRASTERYTEKDMYKDAVKFFSENKYAYLKIASTNVDSLASFAQAARDNNMRMYVTSRYLMKQFEVYREASMKYHTSMYMFSNISPLLPVPEKCFSDAQREASIKQRERMRRDGFVIIASEKDYFNDILDEFKDLNPASIYSMWKGYIDPETKAFNKELKDYCDKTNAIYMHTGGHARPELIKKVIELVNPTEMIIPIHTEDVDGFYNLDLSEELSSKIVTDLTILND